MSPPTEGFSDTAFKENLSRPIHSWVPWIGGFSSVFVEQTLRRFGSSDGSVLDPFCGVGTTLVESARSGTHTIGIELNPFAALAAEVKSHAHELRSEAIQQRLTALGKDHAQLCSERIYPLEFGTREPFFPDENLVQVNKLLNWLDTLPVDLETSLLRLAVGSILVTVSNYSYEPSLSTRTKSGRPAQEEVNVLTLFQHKADSMVSDVIEVQKEPAWGSSTIHVANSMNMGELVEPESVGLVLTSPPYLNNYHYVRNSRPHLFLLGLIDSRKDLIDLQESNFGKYWQTVRNKPLPEIFAKCDTVSKLAESLKLANHSEKKLYNGTGWAAYAISYFNDSKCSLESCMKVMKSGAKAVFVLGDSYIQGVHIPVQDVFACIGEEVGFHLVSCERVRSRNGGSTVRSRKAVDAKEHLTLSEYVVVLSKP